MRRESKQEKGRQDIGGLVAARWSRYFLGATIALLLLTTGAGTPHAQAPGRAEHRARLDAQVAARLAGATPDDETERVIVT
ncbi:MAG: hypothetical protein OEW19_04435, partial [Acidobacteriota bacterium]|nr:hypothetical protein [Acidobacteriota bacterium]